MPRRVLCKFFANGACLKGEHCEFSHDWNDPPNNICTYYQKGMCSYQDRCRYDHVKVSRLRPSASSSSTVLRQPGASASVQVHSSRTVSSSAAGAPSASASVQAHSSRTISSSTAGALSASEEGSASSRGLLSPSKPVWKLDTVHPDLSEDSETFEPRSVKPEDQPICSFAAAGDCPRGEQCPHIHGDLCPTCGKRCLHPFRTTEREEHKKSCEKKQKHLEALKLSQEIECSVCLERVLSKTTAAERKFGLLTECDHPFCISCIRNWRSSSPTAGMDVNSTLRACPICRKLSYFVVPSVIWYSTPEEKKEIIDSYKAKLRSIDCKHFNFGNGNCPFGTSCFYKHTVKPGSYAWKYHQPPPRRPQPRRAPQRSNNIDVDALFDMFEDIIGADVYDPFDYEDLDDDDISELAMLLMHVGQEFDGSSSDDESYAF